MNDTEILLNASADETERLEALKALAAHDTQSIGGGEWVNNHIHTTYSFSPYTPAGAVYFAKKAGLSTAGIMDHDSVGGIHEFIEAGKIVGMPVTVGFECRTDVSGTPLEGKRLNNPDQVSVAYVTLHGIPHQNVGECEKVLAPLRPRRNERNRKMCARLTELCAPLKIEIDFDRDVLPLSMFSRGGSVTERHVLFALAKKLADRESREETLHELEALCDVSPKVREKLLSAPEKYYLYDIL